MEAICSSETSALTRAIRRNIPEDGILRRLQWLRLMTFKGATCGNLHSAQKSVQFAFQCRPVQNVNLST
jgi:hypothetical protein